MAHTISKRGIIMIYQNIKSNSSSIETIKEQVKSNYFSHIPSEQARQIIGEILLHYPSKESINEFINTWFNLEEDTFMADGGKYRERTHAVFASSVSDNSVCLLPYQPHFQTKYYNELNGGVARYFKEIPEQVLKNEVFEGLMKFAYLLFSGLKPTNYFIEVHQFPIKAKEGVIGLPTPEGIHRDGVAYVLMAMVKRNNVQGGETTIYDLDKQPLAQFTLMDTLDIAIVDDTKVFHSVSPVYKHSAIEGEAYRDILVITFKETD